MLHLDMGLTFHFSPVWWVIILIIYIPYFLLLIQRRSYKKPLEVKIQIIFAFVSLMVSIVIEFIAVSNNLWDYTPSNWPIILWFAYFGSGLFGYQLIKKI